MLSTDYMAQKKKPPKEKSDEELKTIIFFCITNINAWHLFLGNFIKFERF